MITTYCRAIYVHIQLILGKPVQLEWAIMKNGEMGYVGMGRWSLEWACVRRSEQAGACWTVLRKFVKGLHKVKQERD